MNINGIIDKLQKIADPAVHHLLEVYTRQAIINGNVSMTVGKVMLAVAALVIIISVYLFYLTTQAVDDDLVETSFLIAFVLLFVGLIVAVFGTVSFVDGYQHSLNPEYYAIEDLLRSIH